MRIREGLGAMLDHTFLAEGLLAALAPDDEGVLEMVEISTNGLVLVEIIG